MPPNNSPRSDIDQLGYFEALPFAKNPPPIIGILCSRFSKQIYGRLFFWGGAYKPAHAPQHIDLSKLSDSPNNCFYASSVLCNSVNNENML